MASSLKLYLVNAAEYYELLQKDVKLEEH